MRARARLIERYGAAIVAQVTAREVITGTWDVLVNGRVFLPNLTDGEVTHFIAVACDQLQRGKL